MIIETIIKVALGFFDIVLGFLPDIEFTGLSDAIDYMFDILSFVCYFLPMGTVTAILSIIYALFIFRLLVSIIMAIWRLIPAL